MYRPKYTHILLNIICMNDTHIEQLITELTEHIRCGLSDFRYAHSVRVAEYAQQLARHYGYPHKMQRLCFLAGITHDMCKELPVSALLALVQTDGMPITDAERQSGELLHGRAAAAVLHSKYGIRKKSFLNAIRYHTIASARFDTVGKIVYIADKIEPGRKNCEYLRKKVSSYPLDGLFRLVLNEVLVFLEQKRQSIHPATEKVRLYLEKKGEIGGKR